MLLLIKRHSGDYVFQFSFGLFKNRIKKMKIAMKIAMIKIYLWLSYSTVNHQYSEQYNGSSYHFVDER